MSPFNYQTSWTPGECETHKLFEVLNRSCQYCALDRFLKLSFCILFCFYKCVFRISPVDGSCMVQDQVNDEQATKNDYFVPKMLYKAGIKLLAVYMVAVVGVVTGYGLDGPGIESQWG